jgi:hypothetical protein
MHKSAESESCFQTSAILIGIAELALLLGVFLTQDTLNQHRMVSTNLFALVYYKVATSILIALQLVMVLLYAMRFRMVARGWVGALGGFVCGALVGWMLTVSFDPNTETLGHSIGAGLFVCFTALYFAVTLSLSYKYDPVDSRRYDLMAYAVLLCAGLFTLVYVYLYFSWSEWAWLFENIGFVLLSAGYLLFFWYHPFDPDTPVSLALRPQQCEPLLLGPYTVPDVDAFY